MKKPEISQEQVDRIYSDFFDEENDINNIVFMLAGAIESVWTTRDVPFRKEKSNALCTAAIARIRSVGV